MLELRQPTIGLRTEPLWEGDLLEKQLSPETVGPLLKIHHHKVTSTIPSPTAAGNPVHVKEGCRSMLHRRVDGPGVERWQN